MQTTYQIQLTIASKRDYKPNLEEVAYLVSQAVTHFCSHLPEGDSAHNAYCKVYPELIEDITQEGELPIE